MWDGKWASASGSPTASEVWQTDGDWGTLPIGGLVSGAQYCFRAKARNSENTETPLAAEACATTLGATVVTITSATSWNDHGGTPFGLELSSSNIEPRLAGVTKLEFILSDPVATVNGATVACQQNPGSEPNVQSTTLTGGDTVTVTLTSALPDADCCVITLQDDADGASFAVRSLGGDVNRNGLVANDDKSNVKFAIGETLDASNFIKDINGNGTIANDDKSLVKFRIGNSVTCAP